MSITPVAGDVARYPTGVDVMYRDLSTLDDFTAVVALERDIWGPDYDEAVPAGVLKATTARGAILIGAFAGDRLVGFVYSVAATKNGVLTHWSHKLGVTPACRNGSIGERLKRLQRERALAMGVDLIEWTFDPLQAANAHLNLTKLGVLVERYEPDFYGATMVPVRQRHHPTDRFIVSWSLRHPRVEQKLAGTGASHMAIHEAVHANRVVSGGEWPECGEGRLDIDAPIVAVEIPVAFGDMLARAPDRALAWRLTTRRIFTDCFAAGYRAIEFALDLERRTGTYLLARDGAVDAVSHAALTLGVHGLKEDP